jgi:solute carrier family 25 carnitine/acylcarnitine transporter 20/29
MDLIKVRQQTSTSTLGQAQRPSSIGMLRAVARNEGLSGLYAGLSAPLLGVIPAFAITFWSFDFAMGLQRRYSSSDDDSTSIGKHAVAGAFSGIPLALVIGPLERCKCLIQVGKFLSFRECVRATYASEGLRGIFRGTTATLARDVPGNAAYFATYEFFKRTLSTQQEDYLTTKKTSIPTTLLAGGLAGCANWCVAIPMDVLKSRLQTAPANTYRNIVHVAQVLVETEGPTALFKGLSPALLRAFPANAACLLGVETARSVLYSS